MPVRYTPYCVPACSGLVGVKLAVRPSAASVTVPGSTSASPTVVGYTSRFAGVTPTCLLKRTRTTALVGTPLLVVSGSTVVTAGGVKSAPAPVVNVVPTGALIGRPLRSATPASVSV